MLNNILLVVLCAHLIACTAQTLAQRPLIIGHRGSPCLVPDETLASFQRAMDDGADYIEMDAVSTEDGVLVARHDLTLDSSTDVAVHPEFANRSRTELLPDGTSKSGVFVSNMTAAELQTLWAKQPLPFRTQAENKKHRVATIAEALQLARPAIAAGQLRGVMVETKQPTYHDRHGLPLEQKLVNELVNASYGTLPSGSVILESFELQSLEKLSTALRATDMGSTPLVWLLNCSASVALSDLEAFAEFGHAIGPDKAGLAPAGFAEECGMHADPTCSDIGTSCSGRLQHPLSRLRDGNAFPSQLVANAKAAGLKTFAYTFRSEARFQPIDFAADPAAELDYYAGPNGSLGIDGLFTDCPATAVAWWSSTLSTPEAQKERSNEQAEQARGHSILFVFIIVVLVLVVGGPLSCILWALWQRWRRRRQYDNLQDVQTFEMPDTRRFPHEDGHFRQGVSNGAV